MTRIRYVLAGAALAALTCAACSQAPRSEIAGSAGRNAWTIPGVLRIADRRTPDTLMPITGTQTIDTDLGMFWAGRLLDYDDNDRAVPDLATEEPTLSNGGISKDGLTITYHLRRGVTWQDGAPFGAGDVIFTWQQVMNPDNAVPSRQAYDDVARIGAPDDHTIVVHLKEPYAPFVATFFSMGSTSYTVLPKHLLSGLHDLNHTDFANKPVGTGPFVVAEYDKGSSIRFVANRHYWRGPPKLEQIDYHFIGNDVTALTMVKTHDIDAYVQAAAALAPSLKGIPGTRVLLSPHVHFTDLGFNAANPILADVRVRKALAYGTDIAALIAKVTEGVDIPADSDQPPWFWAHSSHVTRYRFDPARAGALLDQVGWTTGADGIRRKAGQPMVLTLVSYTGSAVATATEAVIQRQWRDVGVDVSIKNYPSDVLYRAQAEGGIEQTGKFDVALEQWSNGSDPDESILFRCDLAPPHGWNIYHFCSPELDAAERDALRHYDIPTRKADYAKAQAILTDRLPILVLWFERDQDVLNDDLRNFKPAHAGSSFWNPWEWSL